MKFLLWLAIIVIIFAWVMRSKKNVHPVAGSQTRPVSSDQTAPSEPMLQCAKCGVHIPASEAIAEKDGQAFCSEDHRRQTFSA